MMNNATYKLVFAKDADGRADLLPALRHQPWWVRWHVLAVLWVAALAYGSLLPFKFDHGMLAEFDFALFFAAPFQQWRAFPMTSREWTVDIATNLALYGALGLFVRMGLWKRGWPVVAQFIGVIVVLFSVSYAVECVQGLMPMRIASIVDVAANTMGGFAVALFAGVAKRFAKWMVFGLHVRLLKDGRWAMAWLKDRRRSVWFALACIVIDAMIVAGWWLVQANSAAGNETVAAEGGAWPFARAFMAEYHIAFAGMAWTLVGYMAVVALLCVQLLGMPLRHRAVWLAMFVLGVSIAVQFAFGVPAAFDMTQPILALLAVAMLLLAAHLWMHTVKLCDRRKSRMVVSIERRNRRRLNA